MYLDRKAALPVGAAFLPLFEMPDQAQSSWLKATPTMMTGTIARLTLPSRASENTHAAHIFAREMFKPNYSRLL